MCSRIFALFTTGLFTLCGSAFGQFLPNRPQFDNGVNLGTFVQADVNNDGKTDVIGTRSLMAPKPNFQIVVLLGNGTGGFGAPVVTAITGVDQSSSFVAIQPFVTGDFNGDGRVDVAVFGTDHVTGQFAIAVLLGNGNGTFQVGKETIIGTMGGTPSTQECASAAGDYNGDDKLDFAYTSSSGIVVLPGKGDGTFSAPVVTAQTGGCFATGDFNGDKKLDLAVSSPTGTSPGSVSLLVGNGNGAFHAPVAIGAGSGTLVAADLNEDGHLDLVTSSGSIYLGDGGGHFPTKHTISTNDGRTIIVRDVNGDSHPDIVVQDGEGAFDIFLNNGSGSFPAGKRYVNDGAFVPGLVAADLNGDGKTDLAFANSALGITVLSGKGNGTFNANIATTGFTLAPKVAVFSPGQKLSILDSNFTEKFMLGNGDGTFTVKNTNCTVRFAAIGDFNHDGKIDYAGMNSVGSTPYIEACLNNGDGTFTSTGQQFDVGVGHGLLLAGDFNNDGKLDLMASDANGFTILLGNGDGTFQNGIPTASPAGGSTLYALADFNHDGKLDVAVVSSPSTCYVFLGKGDGTFEGPITSPAAGTGSLSAADINGDGKPDLVLANGNYVAVMLGKGDGTFQTPVRYTVTNGVFGNPVVADFNLDGHLDVAIGSEFGELTILFNDGTGKLTAQTSFRIPRIYKYSLAVGDFNGDRRPDLVFLIDTLNGIVGTVETMLHQ